MLSSSLRCSTCGAPNAAGGSLCDGCNHPLLLSSYVGSTMLFQDRYRLIEKLGSGGFGSVYKAADTLFANALVAIKEIYLGGLAPQLMEEVADAFQHEGELLSQLAHPGLPQMHEQIYKQKLRYLVLDFIEGETLEEYQDKEANKRLPLSEVFAIGMQLCDILEYLHSQYPPIIYRDLKPTNIMRSRQGKIFLIDFGIARFFKPGQGKDTIPLGSHGYAAPEQYGKAQTTPRSDIYSLGAVLHQMLTGHDPSDAPLRFARLKKKQKVSDPGSLTTSMVEVMMNSLGGLIDSMLEMEMERRPASVGEVKQDLRQLAAAWAEIVNGYFRARVPRSGTEVRQRAR